MPQLPRHFVYRRPEFIASCNGFYRNWRHVLPRSPSQGHKEAARLEITRALDLYQQAEELMLSALRLAVGSPLIPSALELLDGSSGRVTGEDGTLTRVELRQILESELVRAWDKDESWLQVIERTSTWREPTT